MSLTAVRSIEGNTQILSVGRQEAKGFKAVCTGPSPVPSLAYAKSKGNAMPVDKHHTRLDTKTQHPLQLQQYQGQEAAEDNRQLKREPKPLYICPQTTRVSLSL